MKASPAQSSAVASRLGSPIWRCSDAATLQHLIASAGSPAASRTRDASISQNPSRTRLPAASAIDSAASIAAAAAGRSPARRRAQLSSQSAACLVPYLEKIKLPLKIGTQRKGHDADPVGPGAGRGRLGVVSGKVCAAEFEQPDQGVNLALNRGVRK